MEIKVWKLPGESDEMLKTFNTMSRATVLPQEALDFYSGTRIANQGQNDVIAVLDKTVGIKVKSNFTDGQIENSIEFIEEQYCR